MLVNWTQPKHHVFIVCGKTDLRKGIDGLAAVVAENYDLDTKKAFENGQLKPRPKRYTFKDIYAHVSDQQRKDTADKFSQYMQA